MGEVRLARDVRIHRDVAVKLMRERVRDDTTLARFFREARIQGVLEHPAVVPVHDLGIDAEGNPYFVMKRLTGTTLHDVLSASDPEVKARWPRGTLLARLVDICLAIELAHTRGVVHRDLKPANIMLGDFGEAYVLDWGLARVDLDVESPRGIASLSGDGKTEAGELLGTPGYMAPEQARGDIATTKSDVFALGCVLYEILVGRPALPRGIAAIARTLTSDCHRPSDASRDVPPELDALCVRATAADPSTRPSARELGAAIQAFLDGDRDLERRKQLAADAVVAARAELASPGDDARARAMREAGRALALDPTNADAQQILARLLLEQTDRIPAEALEAAERERAETRRRSAVQAGYGYFGMIPVCGVLFALSYRTAWPIIFSMVVSAITGGIAMMLGRRSVTGHSWWLVVFMCANCALILATGLMFGPLLVMPFVIVGSLAAFLTQPSRFSKLLIASVHLAPLAIVVALEATGVIPQSLSFVDGALTVTPLAVEVTPITLGTILVLAFSIQFASTLYVQGDLRRRQEDAQNRIHATNWHLEQVVPAHRALERERYCERT
jgi:serine/threonine-protein kinase